MNSLPRHARNQLPSWLFCPTVSNTRRNCASLAALITNWSGTSTNLPDDDGNGDDNVERRLLCNLRGGVQICPDLPHVAETFFAGLETFNLTRKLRFDKSFRRVVLAFQHHFVCYSRRKRGIPSFEYLSREQRLGGLNLGSQTWEITFLYILEL